MIDFNILENVEILSEDFIFYDVAECSQMIPIVNMHSVSEITEETE